MAIINEKTCKVDKSSIKGNWDANAWFAALMIYNDIDINEGIDYLLKRELVDDDGKLKKSAELTLVNIAKKNTLDVVKSSSFMEVAEEFKKIWPKGKKPQTNNPWCCSVILLAKRLEQWNKKYNTAGYTNNQIIEAARMYVETNKSSEFMRTAEYFIFKNDSSRETSDLLNILDDPSCLNEMSARNDMFKLAF